MKTVVLAEQIDSLLPTSFAFEGVVSVAGEKAGAPKDYFDWFSQPFGGRTVEDKNMQKHLAKEEKKMWSIPPSRRLPHDTWN